MTTYDFLPELVFNMDETMLDASGYKVKVLMHAHNPCFFTKNEIKLEHITLSLCISASGSYTHPFAILPLKNLPYLHLKVTNFNKFSILSYLHPHSFSFFLFLALSAFFLAFFCFFCFFFVLFWSLLVGGPSSNNFFSSILMEEEV